MWAGAKCRGDGLDRLRVAERQIREQRRGRNRRRRLRSRLEYIDQTVRPAGRSLAQTRIVGQRQELREELCRFGRAVVGRLCGQRAQPQIAELGRMRHQIAHLAQIESGDLKDLEDLGQEDSGAREGVDRLLRIEDQLAQRTFGQVLALDEHACAVGPKALKVDRKVVSDSALQLDELAGLIVILGRGCLDDRIREDRIRIRRIDAQCFFRAVVAELREEAVRAVRGHLKIAFEVAASGRQSAIGGVGGIGRGGHTGRRRSAR